MRSKNRMALYLLIPVLAVLSLPAQAMPAQRLAIVGATVYPSPGAPVIDNAVILIEGDRIKAVGRRGTTPVPAGYRIIDQSGATVTAGFWNSHVHLITPVFLRAADASDAELGQELEHDFTRWGFTTVFDLASTSAIADEVKQRLAARRVRGPRVLSVEDPFYPAGATPVYARPFYQRFKLPSAEIVSVSQAAQRVRRQIQDGADGVKLFTGSIVGGKRGVAYMKSAAISALANAAHDLGKPVFAHPTDKKGLELAVRNGVDILAHTTPLMGPWSPEYARWLAARGVALIPTLSLFETMPDPSTPVDVAVQQAAALRHAGGTILFGTDAGFTKVFDTTRELQLLNKALGWRGVLASLTTAPAATFGEAAVRGRIVPGYAADLVVLGGDPADNIANMADVRMVIRGGEVVFDATKAEGQVTSASPQKRSRRKSVCP